MNKQTRIKIGERKIFSLILLLPSTLITSLNEIVPLGLEQLGSFCMMINLMSGCWASTQAFLITSIFSVKQTIAFGQQLNIWREISSLVYDGLIVVAINPPSTDPKNAMAYSISLKKNSFKKQSDSFELKSSNFVGVAAEKYEHIIMCMFRNIKPN